MSGSHTAAHRVRTGTEISVGVSCTLARLVALHHKNAVKPTSSGPLVKIEHRASSMTIDWQAGPLCL